MSQLYNGKIIATNEFLLNIAPKKEPNLIAKIYIPSKMIGFVKKNQELRLQYDTFAYQKFGSFSAKITAITTTPALSIDIPFLNLQKNKGLFYEVLAHIKTQHIPLFDKQVRLIAGITFKSELILEKRSLIEWFFEPYYGAYRRTNSDKLGENIE